MFVGSPPRDSDPSILLKVLRLLKDLLINLIAIDRRLAVLGDGIMLVKRAKIGPVAGVRIRANPTPCPAKDL